MRYRKLPLQIRRRVQDYYEHRYHHKLFDEDAILRELSFPLREVRLNIIKVVVHHSLFRELLEHPRTSDKRLALRDRMAVKSIGN